VHLFGERYSNIFYRTAANPDGETIATEHEAIRELKMQIKTCSTNAPGTSDYAELNIKIDSTQTVPTSVKDCWCHLVNDNEADCNIIKFPDFSGYFLHRQ